MIELSLISRVIFFSWHNHCGILVTASEEGRPGIQSIPGTVGLSRRPAGLYQDPSSIPATLTHLCIGLLRKLIIVMALAKTHYRQLRHDGSDQLDKK